MQYLCLKQVWPWWHSKTLKKQKQWKLLQLCFRSSWVNWLISKTCVCRHGRDQCMSTEPCTCVWRWRKYVRQRVHAVCGETENQIRNINHENWELLISSEEKMTRIRLKHLKRNVRIVSCIYICQSKINFWGWKRKHFRCLFRESTSEQIFSDNNNDAC